MPDTTTTLGSSRPDAVVDDATPASRYDVARARTQALAAPLSPEDATVQSMDDTSPSKWHLAHTTWFFEQFVLGMRDGYRVVHDDWDYLFNSYYNSVGPMHARPQRGLLTRPGLAQVLAYREEIDARMAQGFERGDFGDEALQRITLGLHHEQQHQELLLTDIKHAFSRNPLHPAYREDLEHVGGGMASSHPLRWITGSEGIVEIGAPAWPQHQAFAFDSETPRHRVLLHPHVLAHRPVSNAEYREFIDDGGYRNASLWMSEGWSRVQDEAWAHPLYWDDDCDREFTLGGQREFDPNAPVSHLSYYEADAFARWAGARLPTEAEWEHAAAALPVRGNFVESDALHPLAGEDCGGLQQMFGDVWEWTSSAYMPYPGFRTLPGALGEYNGKFMCGQWILRGGSCASPAGHLRASYRNFFHPPDRWQFSGLRLAKDLP
ncbi:ergothioneine biosynthesis protein EgtB [Thermomonas sp.]|uniref:ergothioneine biosynthesis protein EgtB n=1 Tax=Thermomonas sp. TaxID=1971895 RepID=UPI002487B1CC|nr:ergothioneine biosynthesis protein EgtB [Thermomonas sp.]MDI1252232.1 ergothioneine biosynthesis protein EgtB [Thermomonas sp.]